jgi:hypothetical protein
MARSADPMAYAMVVAWVYIAGIPVGVVTADDRAVRDSEAALHNAERSGDDFALAQAQGALGVTLVHRHTASERCREQQLLAEVSEMCRRQGQAWATDRASRCTWHVRRLGVEIAMPPSQDLDLPRARRRPCTRSGRRRFLLHCKSRRSIASVRT